MLFSPLKEEELNALRRQEFELLCTSVTFSHCDGRKAEGAGTIKQVPNGFDIKAIIEGTLDFGSTIERINRGKAGKLIAREEYWSVEAIDSDGRRWVAEQVLQPESGGHLDQPRHIQSAIADRLTCISPDQTSPPPTTSHGLVITWHQSFEFPKNQRTVRTTEIEGESQKSAQLDTLQFTDGGTRFRFTADPHPTLWALKEVPFAPDFVTRVREALLFTWAIDERVLAISKDDSVTIFPAGPPTSKRPPKTPCKLFAIDIDGRSVEIFTRYLQWISTSTGPEYRPLSQQVLAIRRAQGGSVEAEALTLAVAAEAILASHFSNWGLPSSAFVASVGDLETYLDRWEGSPQVLARVKGSIGPLRTARAFDRLIDLEQRGVVSLDLILAWKKLRNSTAHGKWDLSTDLQLFLDNIERVRVLVYQLVFHLIGYVGTHTDYSIHRWPKAMYPPYYCVSK